MQLLYILAQKMFWGYRVNIAPPPYRHTYKIHFKDAYQSDLAKEYAALEVIDKDILNRDKLFLFIK